MLYPFSNYNFFSSDEPELEFDEDGTELSASKEGELICRILRRKMKGYLNSKSNFVMFNHKWDQWTYRLRLVIKLMDAFMKNKIKLLNQL